MFDPFQPYKGSQEGNPDSVNSRSEGSHWTNNRGGGGGGGGRDGRIVVRPELV